MIREQYEPLECINGPEDCSGPIEYRMPLSGTGQSFPRCEHHWEWRLREEERIQATYGSLTPPSDWSHYDAGEYWGEDDY